MHNLSARGIQVAVARVQVVVAGADGGVGADDGGRRVPGGEVHIVVDTGASRTFAELSYCMAQGIAVTDTGKPGHGGTVHTVDDARLALEGLPVHTDGLLSLDMSNTNQMLAGRGVEPICAVIGQDALRNHQAVIDYATLRIFLKMEPDLANAA